VSALDDTINDLYKQPLADFTSARNALAKSLTGDDAKRVKALAKPTLVPWAANQVYWRARATYDRLLKSGERLRKAQIAALEGKSSDVRAATDQHRRAIADAVTEAGRLAGAEGSKPAPDALMRTFEALSLAPEPPEPHGRLTEALQPSGFEALTGVAISEAPRPRDRGPAKAGHHADHGPAKAGHHLQEEPAKPNVRGVRLQADRDLKREREEAEAARKHEAELKKADAAVARAEAHEKLARDAWERAHDELLAARARRTALKSQV
jgi:hypothetical protein